MKVLQSIQTFHEGLLDLAGKIKQSLAEVAEIQDLATIKILKDTIVGIMEAVHNAAVYIQKYSGKGVSGKFCVYIYYSENLYWYCYTRQILANSVSQGVRGIYKEIWFLS